jgi:hypothetical protein
VAGLDVEIHAKRLLVGVGDDGRFGDDVTVLMNAEKTRTGGIRGLSNNGCNGDGWTLSGRASILTLRHLPLPTRSRETSEPARGSTGCVVD